MSVGFTPQRSVQVLGFASNGLLTPLRRLYPLAVRQTSALPTASSRFHLTMDTLAVQLTLPLAGCVEDFHLQVSAPCRAHHKKAWMHDGIQADCGQNSGVVANQAIQAHTPYPWAAADEWKIGSH
jgi:hypothetical protein